MVTRLARFPPSEVHSEFLIRGYCPYTRATAHHHKHKEKGPVLGDEKGREDEAAEDVDCVKQHLGGELGKGKLALVACPVGARP